MDATSQRYAPVSLPLRKEPPSIHWRGDCVSPGSVLTLFLIRVQFVIGKYSHHTKKNAAKL